MNKVLDIKGLSILEEYKERYENYLLLASQFISVFAVLFCLGVYLGIDFISPDFFGIEISDFWLKTDNILLSLLAYKWLFVWSIILSVFTTFLLPTIVNSREILFLDSLTSIGAGIVEEMGYRCAYVLFTMLTLLFLDFCWKWIAVIVLLVVILAVLYNFFKDAPTITWVAAMIVGLAISFGIIYLAHGTHPVYWFYEKIVFTVLHWVSFGTLDSILFNQSFPFLFIAALVSVNAKYRNGHKYQGLIGFLSAWITGFVLIHIMMYQGLAVAIIAHIIADLLFAVVRFFTRKFA